MTFKIQKAKDVPDNPVHPPERGPVYPFGKMRVGEVFVVPPSDPSETMLSVIEAFRIRYAAHSYGEAHNKKFKVSRQQYGSIRVERIA